MDLIIIEYIAFCCLIPVVGGLWLYVVKKKKRTKQTEMSVPT
jgi:hypothetical protein